MVYFLSSAKIKAYSTCLYSSLAQPCAHPLQWVRLYPTVQASAYPLPLSHRSASIPQRRLATIHCRYLIGSCFSRGAVLRLSLAALQLILVFPMAQACAYPLPLSDWSVSIPRRSSLFSFFMDICSNINQQLDTLIVFSWNSAVHLDKQKLPEYLSLSIISVILEEEIGFLQIIPINLSLKTFQSVFWFH